LVAVSMNSCCEKNAAVPSSPAHTVISKTMCIKGESAMPLFSQEGVTTGTNGRLSRGEVTKKKKRVLWNVSFPANGFLLKLIFGKEKHKEA